jgi:hypothetical protein
MSDMRDSKLCALATRHAPATGSAALGAQLGKGVDFAPPRCIPSPMPLSAATETVPVSAPSALCAAGVR